MKKILVVPVIAILTCIPISAQSWWGPYGGPYWGGVPHPYAAPYWGGYAPPVYAPPYPAYAPPPAYYAQPWRREPDHRAPWGPEDMYDDDFAGPDGKDMFEPPEADRKQVVEAIEARRAEARKRKAKIKAKRDAWRQQMEQMRPMDQYPGQPAPESSTMTESQPQTPSAVTAPVVEPLQAPAATTTKP